MARCPSCSAFLSLKPFIELVSDWVFCRNCGTKHHAPTVFDIASPSVGVPRFIPSLKSNVQTSNLQPNGKLKKVKVFTDFVQMDLFSSEVPF